MRKNYIIVSVMTIAGALVMMSSSNGRSDDRTGAPSSDGNCSSCHSGGTLGGTLSLIVTEKGTFAPLTSYQAGKTYTIAVSLQGGMQKGFQSTILDAANKKTGTIANPTSGSKLITANSRDIVVQSSPSLSGLWSYEWTAPASPTGRVTIYTSGIAANANSQSSGDQVVSNSTILTLDASSSTSNNKLVFLAAYPNPCNDVLQLNSAVDKIEVTGINGATYATALNGLSINTINLPQGFYFLKWMKGTETGIIKFQKI